jgi:NAD(P) transhydrogenase subunit alpha
VSGITLIGAIAYSGNENLLLAQILGSVSVFLATINVVGGYMVTDRMLAMFKSK